MSRQQTATLFLIVVLLATILSAETIGAEVLCGDVNGDGHGPNIGDLTFLVAFIFHSGETTGYFLPADVNGQFGINISDVTYFVSFLFQGGPPPICPATGVLADGNGCINMGFKSEVAGEPYATSSDCLEEVSDESMWVELIGNDLHVHHMNAYYNCCLMYDVTFDIEGRNITACEADTGDQCFCLCYFDLEAVLPGLEITEPCEYVVTLIGIEGDTVGVDTLAIGGEEYMYVDVINDDLYIHHMNAYANCCPEFFYYSFVDGNEITVIEWDSLYGCDCICLFNFQSTMTDLPPGEYVVTLIGVCVYPDLTGCPIVGVDTVVVGTVRE